jgi:hypothetical protein
MSQEPVTAIAQRDLIAAATDIDVAARAVATQVGYQLPADSTSPDLIMRDIAANMRRSVEACLEVGRGLLVLKQVCAHGNFITRLSELSVDRKVAAKFMQAARKFSNVSSTRHLLSKIDSQTKLFELLVLDDEDLEELAETGQTGGLVLDKIACMSVTELRKTVRDRDAAIAAKDAVALANQKTIQELQERLATKPVAPEPPDDAGGEDVFPDPARDAIADFEEAVIGFREYVIELRAAFTTLAHAIGDGPLLLARRHAALETVLGEIRQIAVDFGVPLRLADDEDVPRTDEEIGAEIWERINAAADARESDDGIIDAE